MGSGLVTYVNVDTTTLGAVVTAGHVVKWFQENNVDSFYLRFSWADTIKTTQYFGVGIPRVLNKKLPTSFTPFDTTIDLGCIVLPEFLVEQDKVIADYYGSGRPSVVFPYNSMSFPRIGDAVWIYGYPEHMESGFQKDFSYCISTLVRV